MTSSPSAAQRALRRAGHSQSLPAITENHLRYLEKWGLVRADAPRDERLFSFTDLPTIKQLAAELERGTPLRVILRSLLAEHQGQLALDFHRARAADTPRAKVLSLLGARRSRATVSAARPISPGRRPSCDASLGPTSVSDPQAALAAKYFIEGRAWTTGTSGRWRRRRPPTARRW